MTEKMKVSHEIAESIEEGKNNAIGCWEDEIMHAYVTGYNNEFKDIYPKYKWFANYTPFEFANLILNGYEVEQTPEKIIKEIYHYKYGSVWGDGYQPGVQYGVKKTLDTLNIQIKGVNA